jgi:hypothetical protein
VLPLPLPLKAQKVARTAHLTPLPRLQRLLLRKSVLVKAVQWLVQALAKMVVIAL